MVALLRRNSDPLEEPCKLNAFSDHKAPNVHRTGLVLRRTVLSPSWEDQMGLTSSWYIKSAQLVLIAHTGATVYKPCRLMTTVIALWTWLRGVGGCASIYCFVALTLPFPYFLFCLVFFFFKFLFSFNWKGSAWDLPKTNSVSGVYLQEPLPGLSNDWFSLAFCNPNIY